MGHESDEFVSMSLYFPSIDSTNHPAYAHIHRELHIVKRFKANLLVGNDILATKRVIIDLVNKSAMILSCQMTISIAAWPKDYPVQRKVLVDRSLTIPPESKALMQFVYSSFPDNRDFLFNSTSHTLLIYPGRLDPQSTSPERVAPTSSFTLASPSGHAY